MLLGLLIALQLLGGTPARAQQGFAVVPAGAEAGSARLVVECPGAGAGREPSFAVTVDGRPQPVTAVPLLSERLALAAVVDASREAGAVLQPGISGVVDLVLGAPAGLRAALVADTGPPVVVTPLGSDPAALLDGLSALRPGGDRQTVAALDLAARQLPPEAGSPRLVVLHTGAADAPGRSAADLAAGLSAAGIVLGVVATGTDGGPVPPYWAAAAAATGGTAVSVRETEAVAGFTRLTTALRTRYVVTVPAPARLPADATVRVEAPGGPFTAAVTLPAPPAPPAGVGPVPPPGAAPDSAPDAGAGPGAGLGVAAGLAMLVLVVVGVAVRGRRTAPRRDDPDHGTDDRGADDRAQAAPPAGGAAGPPPARGAAGPRPPAWAAAGPVWGVPARPDPVTDREELLAAMGGSLRAGRPLVLHGDGPVGRGATTAMIEFAHRHRHEYDIAWWVAAEDPPSVRDRLAELAEILDLAGPDDTTGTATDRLRDALRRTDRWLLLLDDPPGPAEVARLLPDGPGHVVVCSADPQWREHGAALPVPAMRRAESVELLRARCPVLTDGEAEQVATASDDVPLALVPAAATLAITRMSVGGYLYELATHRADDDAPPWAAVWAVASDRLAVDDPPALALLTFVAWLSPQPVPLALLTRHPELLPRPRAAAARDPLRLAAHAEALRRRGLARAGSDDVQLHPAPAARLLARTGAAPAGGPGWAASAVRVLRAHLADVPVPADPLDPACRTAWRQLLPHVLAATDPARDLADVADEVSWLIRQAGRYLHVRGEARFARALLMDAYELYRQRLGEDHPDTVASARDLAADLHALGRLNGTGVARTTT